jgi:hypothetical protein
MRKHAVTLSLAGILGIVGIAQAPAAGVTPEQRNLRSGRKVFKPRPPAVAPSDMLRAGPEDTDTIFSYPSSSSTIVGSVGFIDAEQVGYFWSVGRGDSVTETFAAAEPSVTSYKLDVDVVENVLNSGAFVNWDVLINGVTVDNFTVNEGFLGTVSRTASFAAIAGPNYTVELRVTNEVAGGQGSHSLRYAGTGLHQVELLGQTDPVRYLQLNEFADCYIVNWRQPDRIAYGDIPFYPASFTGAREPASVKVGWTLDGGPGMLLTVFRDDLTEELWLYGPGSGLSMIGTATWSFVSSCAPVDDVAQRPSQLKQR